MHAVTVKVALQFDSPAPISFDDMTKVIHHLNEILHIHSGDYAAQISIEESETGESVMTCREVESVASHYPDGKCPDCGEPIGAREEGEACRNCGHVFWSPKDNDDDEPTVEEYAEELRQELTGQGLHIHSVELVKSRGFDAFVVKLLTKGDDNILRRYEIWNSYEIIFEGV